jgi:hypothetical protein
VVADALWSDEAVLDRCLDFVLPAMLRREPVVAWVVDDTGFPEIRSPGAKKLDQCNFRTAFIAGSNVVFIHEGPGKIDSPARTFG